MSTCWKAYGVYFQMVLVPRQNSYRAAGNLQNKPRISSSPNLIWVLGLVIVSWAQPKAVCALGQPQDVLNCIYSVAVIVQSRVLLRLFCRKQFRHQIGLQTPTRELNHSYAIWLQSILFLLVFFDSHAGISLLGEVNRVSAQLITRGDVRVQEAGSICVATPPKSLFIRTFRKIGNPSAHQVVSELQVHHQVRLVSLPQISFCFSQLSQSLQKSQKKFSCYLP